MYSFQSDESPEFFPRSENMNGLTFPFSNMLNMYMSFKLEFNVGAAMATDERSAKIFILKDSFNRSFFHSIARVNFNFGKK